MWECIPLLVIRSQRLCRGTRYLIVYWLEQIVQGDSSSTSAVAILCGNHFSSCTVLHPSLFSALDFYWMVPCWGYSFSSLSDIVEDRSFPFMTNAVEKQAPLASFSNSQSSVARVIFCGVLDFQLRWLCDTWRGVLAKVRMENPFRPSGCRT